MRKTAVTFLFSVLVTITWAQDLIMKKDSSRIMCKITKEDDQKVYYYLTRDKQKTETFIMKTEVLKYLSNSPIPKSGGARADTASKIYNAKIRTKGFYENYKEYISNAPSTVNEFVVIERSQSDLMINHGSTFCYSIKGQEECWASHWGFCDGQNIYVHYDHPKGYCKMEAVGPYSYFTYVVHGTGAMALIPDQLMVIDQEGKFHDGTVKFVKKTLEEKAPELYKEYDASDDQKQKRKQYLDKLNELLLKK